MNFIARLILILLIVSEFGICQYTVDNTKWVSNLTEYRNIIEKLFSDTEYHYSNHNYIESYSVRALVVNYNLETDSRKEYNYFIKWADRIVKEQGKVLNPAAYDIGYGATDYSKPERWYVADASAIALALTKVAHNKHVEGALREKYVSSGKKFADFIISEWQNPNGSVALGFENKKISPVKEYWCSTSLFGAFLWNLYDITNDEKYKKSAISVCDWLLSYDYESEGDVDGTNFQKAMPAYAFYLGDGLIVQAQHLRQDSMRIKKIQLKIQGIVNWLIKTQRSDGGWDCKSQWWLQKVPALYTTLNWYYLNINRQDSVKLCADKILEYCLSDRGISELQLKVHAQSSTFMFFALTEKCHPGFLYLSY